MTSFAAIPVQDACAQSALPPSRISCEGAAAPFIVHGHRLSSLYRTPFQQHLSFIVLKILKKQRLPWRTEREYFGNNEAGAV